MDPILRARLVDFLKPYYQDIDGASHLDEVERIGAMARHIHGREDDDLELLIVFHVLDKWLEKVGNLSRLLLAVPGLREDDVRRAAGSIRRLHDPASDGERSLAAAILIDRSGVRGLAERFAGARRAGQSMLDVVRECLADSWVPEWVPPGARPLLESRLESRREMCQRILEEAGGRSELEAYVRSTPARS